MRGLEVSDPVVREVLRLRRLVRRTILATLVLFVMLGVSVVVALYIRSSDLENVADQNNTATIRSCFRQANQRPELLALSRDRTLSPAVRGFVYTIFDNTPKLSECQQLANELGQTLPEDLR